MVLQSSIKIIFIAGSLLVIASGCSPTSTLDYKPAAPTRAGTDPKPAATSPTIEIKLAQRPALSPLPTPSPTPRPSPTPTVAAMPIPEPDGPLYTYHTVETGENLSYIAWRFETTVEDLVDMNDLDGPAAIIHTDQLLRVPVEISNVAPTTPLLPDSEVVYGPSHVDFNIAEFVNNHGGYLATYEQFVDNESLTGPEIVERVGEQFSVGPRLLLALLEHYGGWVTNPTPTESQLNKPLGPRNPRGNDLYRALGFTANRINAGYYGYKRDGFWIFQLADRSQAITGQGVNPGTVGVQNITAIHSSKETWPDVLSPDGLLATYRSLFGDPTKYAVEPLIPITLEQPALSLPWQVGQGFYYTGGAHPAYVDGSAWAAVDFGPPDVLGNCFYSDEPSTAAADGVIAVARQGEVQLDLDGDGRIQTGWVLLYLHVSLDFDTPLQVGQHVSAGDVIGYASCEGGLSNSSHLHFARRFNGEWMDAAGPVPMNLSGWVVQPSFVPYAGSMVNGSEVRKPCECWEADMNLMIHILDD